MDTTPPAIVPMNPSWSDHYLKLARSALDAGTSGTVPLDEAILSAEAYARMTGCTTPEATRLLGEVYLYQRDRELSAGNEAGEQMFGALAMFRLNQAADAGDDAAAARLVSAKVSPFALAGARYWEETAYADTCAAEDQICAAAGTGEPASLNTMLDAIFSAVAQGMRTERDALLLAFAVSRVGEGFGVPSIIRRLAGVLICLGEGDRSQGNTRGALMYETAAMLRLAEAAEAGDSEAADRLPVVVNEFLPAALRASAVHAALLAHLPHAGEIQ